MNSCLPAEYDVSLRGRIFLHLLEVVRKGKPSGAAT